MALIDGFNEIDSANSTFSQWLDKTNAMIVLMREEVLTANATWANTVGNVLLLGNFSANIVYANTMSGGEVENGQANLTVVSNTFFTGGDVVRFADTQNVYIDNDITVNTAIYATSNNVPIGGPLERFDLYADDIDTSGNTWLGGHLIVLGDVDNEGRELQSNSIIAAHLTGNDEITVHSNTNFDENVVVTQNVNITDSAHVTQDTTSNNVTANGVFTQNLASQAGVLLVTSNAQFVGNNVLFSNDVTMGATANLNVTTDKLRYTLTSNNYVDLPPKTTGANIGTASLRWNMFVSQINVNNSIYPVSNLTGTALGTSTQRFNLTANTIDASGLSTLANVNTNVANLANVNATNVVAVTQNVTSNNITGNNVFTQNISSQSGSLTVQSNTLFQDNVAFAATANLTLTTDKLRYTLTSNNYVDLPPKTTGNDLGTAGLRWDAFLSNTNVSGYLNPSANNVALGNSISRWELTAQTVTVANTLTVTALTTLGELNTTTANVSTALYPTTNAIPLGSTLKRWVITANSLALSSTLGVSGLSTLNNLNAAVVNATALNTTGSVGIATNLTANNISGNNVTTANLVGQGGALIVQSNTTVNGTNTVFNSNATFNGTATVGTDALKYTLTSNNYVNLPPKTTGNDLGTASLRWDAFLSNTNVAGYLNPSANNVLLGNTTALWTMRANTINTVNVTSTGYSYFQTVGTTTANATTINLSSGLNANNARITSNTLYGNTVYFNNIENWATSNLEIVPVTNFQNNVLMYGDLQVVGTFNYTVTNDNYDDLVPAIDGYDLGNTTHRWDGFFNNVNCEGYLNPSANNVKLGNTISRWEVTAQTVYVANTLNTPSLTSLTNAITVSPNTTFSNNITVTGNCTVTGAFNGTITSNNYTNILPKTNANDLGSTSLRWDVYGQTGTYYGTQSPSANGGQLGTTLKRWDGFFVDIDASSSVTVDGMVECQNLICYGTANIVNLEVSALITNEFAIVPNTASVTTTSATVIDSFPATEARNVKYIVSGNNASVDSMYMVELLAGHTYGAGTPYCYITRYGEMAIQSNVVISADLNGANVELTATCSSASVANTHNFQVTRMAVKVPV